MTRWIFCSDPLMSGMHFPCSGQRDVSRSGESNPCVYTQSTSASRSCRAGSECLLGHNLIFQHFARGIILNPFAMAQAGITLTDNSIDLFLDSSLASAAYGASQGSGPVDNKVDLHRKIDGPCYSGNVDAGAGHCVVHADGARAGGNTSAWKGRAESDPPPAGHATFQKRLRA